MSYYRMVLRVPSELPQRLATVHDNIFIESRIEYSYSAIVRGAIELGLNQLEGAPCVTLVFNGCQSPRGRRPGGKVATAVVPFDLTEVPLDLEFEDQHHDDRLPNPKKEVVARRRVRRRRRAVALLEPRPAKYEDDEEDPEETPPHGSVLDNKGDDMWSVFYRNRPAPDAEAAARLKDAKARGDAAYEQWHVERLEAEKAQRAKEGRPPFDE